MQRDMVQTMQDLQKRRAALGLLQQRRNEALNQLAALQARQKAVGARVAALQPDAGAAADLGEVVKYEGMLATALSAEDARLDSLLTAEKTARQHDQKVKYGQYKLRAILEGERLAAAERARREEARREALAWATRDATNSISRDRQRARDTDIGAAKHLHARSAQVYTAPHQLGPAPSKGSAAEGWIDLDTFVNIDLDSFVNVDAAPRVQAAPPQGGADDERFGFADSDLSSEEDEERTASVKRSVRFQGSGSDDDEAEGRRPRSPTRNRLRTAKWKKKPMQKVDVQQFTNKFDNIQTMWSNKEAGEHDVARQYQHHVVSQDVSAGAAQVDELSRAFTLRRRRGQAA